MEYDFSKEAELPGKIQYDFSELPVELQRLYLLKLPVPDIANYCAVNPSVHKICVDDYFWLLKVEHDFPGISQYKPENITYQQQFLDLLRITDPHDAAKEGRLDILIYLDSLGKLPDRESDTAENGHLDVLKWLKTKGIYYIETIVTSASKGGHINILEWVGPEGLPYYRDGGIWAAQKGQVDVLDWYETQGILPDVEIANEAAGKGHINVLNWLEQRRIFPTVIGANWAAKEGYIDVLNWLEARRIFPNNPNDIVIRGNINVLEWLAQREILPNVDGANSAARLRFIKILELLEKRRIFPSTRGANNVIFKWNEKDRKRGPPSDGSSLDVLNWLYSRNIYPDINGILLAASNGNIEILDWLETHELFPNNISNNSMNKILYSAILYNQGNGLEWLERRGIRPNVDLANWAADKENDRFFYREKKNINVLEWLAARGIFPNK